MIDRICPVLIGLGCPRGSMNQDPEAYETGPQSCDYYGVVRYSYRQ